MADNQVDFVALGQSIDTSWGRSSTPNTSSSSIKATILGAGSMRIDYHTIFNFMSTAEMIIVRRRALEEAKSVIKEAVKNIKSTYKDLADKTLKMKQTSEGDNFELIGFGSPSVRRMAHYKYTAVFEIG